MKRFILILFAIAITTSAFAQNFSVGARVGSGVEALGQYKLNDKNYIEARIGTSWANPPFMTIRNVNDILSEHRSYLTADFTALFNWHILDMDWTPRGGIWFFDAGVGVNVGGRASYLYVGAAGMARLGFTFNNTPITLSVDWTPVFGPAIRFLEYVTEAVFNEYGLANVGISATYNF